MKPYTPIAVALGLVITTFCLLIAAWLWPATATRWSTDNQGQPPAMAPPTPAAMAVQQAPTATSTPTPTPTAAPLPTPTPTFRPATDSIRLHGVTHAWQTWNNCGPATLAMNLSFFGAQVDQAEIGSVLRSFADDKNVGPEELAAYARSRGFVAQVRVNGSAGLLRTLLSNSLPVLIETWHEETPGDGLGHYRLLTGYDDAAAAWIAYDSYDGRNLIGGEGAYAGIRLPYGEMAGWWRVFNRTYVLVYRPEQAPLVAAILGDEAEPAVMWRRSLAAAQAAVEQRPEDAFTWFNLGSSAVAEGDFVQAATAFDQAQSLGLPWRMLWYQFGPFEAYYRTGRYADALALANATLAGGADSEELHYWRGMALAGLGQQDAARQAWQTALQRNPQYAPAAAALAS